MMNSSYQAEGLMEGALKNQRLWPTYMVGQSAKPIKVILIDDDDHIRSFIKRELVLDPRIDLVGEANSIKTSKKLMKSTDFDVMLADMNLPDGNAIDLILMKNFLRPSAESIVISVMESDVELMKAIEHGAMGYLVKNSWFGGYAQAILEVANGGANITPHLARRILQRLRKTPSEHGALVTSECEKLTPRELDILKYISNGYTANEISEHISISALTVNTHIKNIYKKLKVSSKVQAIKVAIKLGLV